MSVSPFAPKEYLDLPPIKGVTLASGAAGIRYKGRTDLMIGLLSEGTTVAGVFTRSLTASAPVEWCRQNAEGGKARVVVVNSGNSNAFTGKKGVAAVQKTAAAAMKIAGCKEEEVFIASTGVIGEPLPAEKIEAVLPELKAAAKADAWLDTAKAIMTTDTFPKLTTRSAEINGTNVTINGIAKGSGMIAPDMATMLAFIFTDAAIDSAALKTLLIRGTQKSFNCITVDSDTSTSDTVLLFATGAAGNKKPEDAGDPALDGFKHALWDLMEDLAKQIVADGEGISKFITVNVSGAEDDEAAKRIGLSIANSPLVKTAIAGQDANWGRIVAAVGKSGAWADRDRLMIKFGDVVVAENGEVNPNYKEADGQAEVKKSHVSISVDVGVGVGRATIWTCDLTEGYIKINASYRS